MSNLQQQALEKALHPHAQIAAEEHVTNFAHALVLQCKMLATIQGADEVQSHHVTAARDVVLASIHTTKRSSELFILVGSILLGAFLQGFITEYSNSRPGWMVVYVIVGLAGMLLTSWGFRR
jgi:hypothetical protein